MSFIEEFKDATIGFRGYTRLARSRGTGFGYMALLLALVLAIAAAIYTVQARRAFAEMDRRFAAAPDFAIKNGEFSFQGPMPYQLGTPEVPMILDTTGQTNPEALRGRPFGSFLITRDKIFQVGLRGAVTPMDLKALGGDLTKERVRDVIRNLHKGVPFLFLFVYVLQLGAKAVDALLLGAVALLYARSEGRTISFDLGYKLGLYAMTIPLLIQWILPQYSSFRIAGLAIWWGVALLYLILGLRAYFKGEEPAEA